MKQLITLDIEDATIMINAAVKRSKEINVLETICVVDNAGFPIKMERMDGARVTGPQISWNKAFTAATHKRSTHLFNKSPNGPALPGNEAFGIQLSFEGKFTVFVVKNFTLLFSQLFCIPIINIKKIEELNNNVFINFLYL